MRVSVENNETVFKTDTVTVTETLQESVDVTIRVGNFQIVFADGELVISEVSSLRNVLDVSVLNKVQYLVKSVRK